MKFLRFLMLFLATLASLLAVGPAGAAWWEFGRESAEPAITELRFNSVDAGRLDDGMVLTRDDLQAGAVIVRGRAEVGRGEIGLVEISLDQGKTWVAATLGERGLFTWEFRPEVDRKYPFRIRATSTTGVATGPEDHDFFFMVSSNDGSADAKAAFRKLLDAYQRKDRAGFMAGVAEYFEGDFSALEDALSSDFRFLDSIAIQANVNRVVNNSGVYELDFSYNRQVRSIRSGRFLKDSASSVVGFKRGTGGMKLYRMSAPLIFGVSDTGNVATGTVTNVSVGQNVLSVDPYTGEATNQQQQAVVTPAPSSTTVSGTKTLGFAQSYTFDTDTVNDFDFNPTIGDMVAMEWAPNIGLRTGVLWQRVNSGFSATTSAPASGYGAGPITNVSAGQVYALQLQPGPKYAVIEIVTANFGGMGGGGPNVTLTFRYKYQPSGSRSF